MRGFVLQTGILALSWLPAAQDAVIAQVDPELADMQDGGVGNSLGFSVGVVYDPNGTPLYIATGCPFDDGINNETCNAGCVTVFRHDFTVPQLPKQRDIFSDPNVMPGQAPNPNLMAEGDLFGIAVSAALRGMNGDVNNSVFTGSVRHVT